MAEHEMSDVAASAAAAAGRAAVPDGILLPDVARTAVRADDPQALVSALGSGHGGGLLEILHEASVGAFFLPGRTLADVQALDLLHQHGAQGVCRLLKIDRKSVV